MGMFDSVYVDCPYCGKKAELQSKFGECSLNEYTLKNAPEHVMLGLIDGYGWTTCEHCKNETIVKKRPLTWEWIAGKYEDDEH